MKIIAFNGSARADGNTTLLIQKVFDELHKEGIDTELVQLGGSKLQGCTACGHCRKPESKGCIIADDILNECIEKIKKADGIILGSPVYFSDVTTEMKAFIDRVGYVCRSHPEILKHKLGAAVVSVRRAGAMHTFDTLNHFFLINQMIIPCSNYWNIGIGRDKGDVLGDQEGINTMMTLGKNMAWLLKKLKA